MEEDYLRLVCRRGRLLQQHHLKRKGSYCDKDDDLMNDECRRERQENGFGSMTENNCDRGWVIESAGSIFAHLQLPKNTYTSLNMSNFDFVYAGRC